MRSIRTVLPAVGVAGAYAEWRPALSVERNCTTVSPTAVMFTDEPLTGSDQVFPPSVDLRYW